MYRSILTAFICLLGPISYATTYYVSPTGNDSNSGTSQSQAWQTIDRVNQLGTSIHPGDQVLFQRGGTYRGTLTINGSGTSSSPIVVGAYGSGAKPVISGSEAVSGWSVWQGNIWRAPVNEAVQYVFVNGQLMILARYPNTGWLRVDQGNSTWLEDSDLNQPDGYWVGASAVIRTTNWSYDVEEVTGFSGNTLQHTSTGNNLLSYHWGYFLQNKLSELDAPGEWYYEAATGYLYLRAPGDVDPNTLIVEASVHDRGVYLGWQREYVNIVGVAFKHQTEAGVRLSGTNATNVEDCDFSDTHQAISTTGSGLDMFDCLVEHTYATGILVLGSGNTIRNNTVQHIALDPGLGESNWGYLGIRTVGADNIIRENRLTDIGYIGITFDQNALVERNYVSECLAILNDGGGIAFDNCNGAIVRNNIVTDLVGEFTSTAPNYWSAYAMSNGIYFGNTNIQNTLVDGNTVAHCTNMGIYVDHTMNSAGNVISNNVVYDNGTGGGSPHRYGAQVRFSDDSNDDGANAVAPYFVPNYDDTFTGNTLVSLNELQQGLDLYQIQTPAWTDYGSNFGSNTFFTPFNNECINVVDHYAGMIWYRHSLEHWQAETGKESGSYTTPLQFTPYTVTSVLGSELVTNGNFSSNVSGWQYSNGTATLSSHSGVLDGGSMGVQLSTTVNNGRLLVDNAATFNLVAGQYYEFRFSCEAAQYADLWVGVKREGEGWGEDEVTFHRYVGVGPQRKDFDFVFQAQQGGAARVFFRNLPDQPQFDLDNVSLRQVAATYDDPAERIVLFYNDQLTAQTIPLDICYDDLMGNPVTGPITLDPFTSTVLVRDDTGIPCGIATSVDDAPAATNNELQPYPNPVTAGSTLIVPLADKEDVRTVTLHDVSGQLLARMLFAPTADGVSITPPSRPGTYLVRIEDRDGTLHHARFVVAD